MKNKRVVRWFVLVALVWFLQLLVLWGVIIADEIKRGQDAIAPAWMDVWGVIGALIPVGLITITFVGWLIVTFVKWFREDS